MWLKHTAYKIKTVLNVPLEIECKAFKNFVFRQPQVEESYVDSKPWI